MWVRTIMKLILTTDGWDNYIIMHSELSIPCSLFHPLMKIGHLRHAFVILREHYRIMCIGGVLEVGVHDTNWKISCYTLYTYVYPALHHWLSASTRETSCVMQESLSRITDFDYLEQNSVTLITSKYIGIGCYQAASTHDTSSWGITRVLPRSVYHTISCHMDVPAV